MSIFSSLHITPTINDAPLQDQHAWAEGRESKGSVDERSEAVPTSGKLRQSSVKLRTRTQSDVAT